ncbi:hypothetical protein M413DRAFT_9833 [Hebeloma cylindrosporum]|uniref:C2H2-type domain-containing protein n=1 Tax=Hebeloma cylindrosporum TaxID=76867 RepID=A0A0C2XZJ7_HEBCY|nr:hypothetical protein M413DRAFT_9833 [Hebeloma cylindrosporum h7]
MAIRKSIRQPRVHPSTQQRTPRGPSTPTYSPLDNGQPGEGVLSITQILPPPVVHVDLPSQAPSSSFTWILEHGKPSERHERRSGSPRKRAGQGKSDDEELVRTPLIRSRTLESLPPPIPSPPWSRSHQNVLDDMPSSQKYNDLDKRKCRYNLTPGSGGVSLTPRGQEGYSTDDSEYEGSSSRLKNARADAIALAHFREIVESRRVADRSSSDSDDYDPCSRVSTPEGYPEALRNRYKRPRSKSWDRSQLPRSKRQKPWVPTNVVRRAGSDIEMADPAQRGPMDIRQSPGPSCSFATDNDIKMNCLLPSTASSGQSSDPVSLSSAPVDHLDSGAEALNSSSGRFHCPEPGCTASYHSLWAYNRHQAKHQESLHSDTVAVNCSKCGTARKQVGSHTTVESQIRRCSFGCQLSFSHLWKKELHEDRIHKGKALEPSMCRECGAKPT